jgi:hypothetical protein
MALEVSPGVILTPTPTKTATPTNYLSGSDYDWIKQYEPEAAKQIVGRFGSGDITGMLEKTGKEYPCESDTYIWKEEARLTQLGTGVSRSASVFTLNGHTFRPGETIMVRNDSGSVALQGIITEVDTNTFTALCGEAADWDAIGTTALTVFAYSSEFKKRTSGMSQSLNSQFDSFENRHVIIKEMVDESGSNLAKKTWLEVTNSTSGMRGFLWFYQNYNDTEKRFRNKIEHGLIRGKNWTGAAASAGYQGTQGMIDAIKEGNIHTGMITDMEDIDAIINRFEAQGQIPENYMYNNTAQNIAIDDMLNAANVQSVGWGAFDNSENMAISLEFDGFKRAGYSFYKTRWRFLNDPVGEGSMVGAKKVHGVIIPSGSKTVKQVIGDDSTTQPMIHVKYRAGAETNRKFKMVITGAEAGNSRVDEKIVDFYTERMLCVLGRNNTLIAQG